MRTTNDEREKKERKERENSLDLLTGKNIVDTPLQKIYVLFTKSFSPWTYCMEAFRRLDPKAPSNLKYAPQLLKYAKMR